MSDKTPKQTPQEATGHLPEFVLLSLARNESADPAYRKAAVEHLIEKGYFVHVNHPDLVSLVSQIKREKEAKDEVQAIVESAVEDSLDNHGPFKAGFTTDNQMQDEVEPSEPKFGDPALPADPAKKPSRFWGR